MKFPYLKLTTPATVSDFFGPFILKPIIPIVLAVGQNIFDYSALMDSGADFCVFHTSIGQELGLDIENGTKIIFRNAGGGNSEAYMHKITLLIGGVKYQTMVGFSNNLAGGSYGILGQKGFFDLFRVNLDYQKDEIELKEK